MRVAVVRTDISKFYLADVENTSQRNFSSEPKGQSRYIYKPSNAELTAILNTNAFLSALGSENSATVNTSSNNVLKVKVLSSAAFTSISVTADIALGKAQLVSELNAGFVTNSLKVVASLVGNKVKFQTIGTNAGPSAYFAIDTTAHGSSLNSKLDAGWVLAPPALTGLSVAALKAAVYPTASTVDVSSATILALSTWTNLTPSIQTTLVNSIADLVAPKFVETSKALYSFLNGNLSKMKASNFQPGGSRGIVVAGAAVAVVADDGSTPFTV
jgi:hypothetical protein